MSASSQRGAGTRGHAVPHGRSPVKSVVAALVANSLIAASKLVAAAITGSSGMFAEALHSLADTGNQALLLLGLRKARVPPDREHPFGHGKERFFWAFLVAVSMFTIGAAFSLWKGVTSLLEPHHVESPLIALGVLGGAVVFEAFALRVAWVQFREVRAPGTSLWRALRDARDPEVVTVLMEDSAAITGLLLATGGIVLTELTGDATFDALASVAIGLLLAAVAFFLGQETKALLIGESGPEEAKQRIADAAERIPEVEEVVELLTMQIGASELLVTLDARFREDLDTRELEAAIDRFEDEIRRCVPGATRIFVEPERRE